MSGSERLIWRSLSLSTGFQRQLDSRTETTLQPPSMFQILSTRQRIILPPPTSQIIGLRRLEFSRRRTQVIHRAKPK